MNIIHTAQGRFGQELKEMQIKKKTKQDCGKRKDFTLNHVSCFPTLPGKVLPSFLYLFTEDLSPECTVAAD